MISSEINILEDNIMYLELGNRFKLVKIVNLNGRYLVGGSWGIFVFV